MITTNIKHTLPRDTLQGTELTQTKESTKRTRCGWIQLSNKASLFQEAAQA